MSSSTPVPAQQPTHPRKTKLLALLIVVFLAAISAAFFFWPESDSGHREDALAVYRSGRFGEAELPLKEALARNPNDTEVLDCLARGYLKAGRPMDAEPYLTRLIELNPRNPEPIRLRMGIYREQKQRELAYADTRRLLELEPDDVKLRHTAMGQAFSVGEFAESETLCRELLNANPLDRSLRSMLAQIRNARGDDEGAAKILDDLLGENPNDYGTLFARGILHDQGGQSDRAIPLLRRVYSEDPSRRRTCGYQLAIALGKVGQQAEADKIMLEVRRLQDVEVFREAIKTQPENLELKVRLAQTLLREGHVADGLELMEIVLKMDSKYRPAHLALAEHFESNGQTERARKHREMVNNPR